MMQLERLRPGGARLCTREEFATRSLLVFGSKLKAAELFLAFWEALLCPMILTVPADSIPKGALQEDTPSR